MNPKQQAFVRAYLGEAQGNGTKAAIAAGYSERTAGQIASQLLKHPEVSAALGRRIAKAEASADKAMQNVWAIANTPLPEKVKADTILKANELILRVEGKLKDKGADSSKVIVNIGFLHQPGQAPYGPSVATLVMPQPARVGDSD